MDRPRSRQGGFLELGDDCARVLREEAGSYARVALANLKREFPGAVRRTMTAPDGVIRGATSGRLAVMCHEHSACSVGHWAMARPLGADL